jgi:hypothetical protein
MRPPGYGLDPDSPCDEVINYTVTGGRKVMTAQVRVTYTDSEHLAKLQREAIFAALKWAAEHREELEAKAGAAGPPRVTAVEIKE